MGIILKNHMFHLGKGIQSQILAAPDELDVYRIYTRVLACIQIYGIGRIVANVLRWSWNLPAKQRFRRRKLFLLHSTDKAW